MPNVSLRKTERTRPLSGLGLAALLLHLLWIVPSLFFVIEIYTTPHRENGDEIGRALKIVAETGRLDFLSLILTLFTIVLGIAAIGGFFVVRSAAISAAHDEIENQLSRRGRDLVEPAVADYMDKNGGAITERWLENNPNKLNEAVRLAGSINDDRIDTDRLVEGLDDDETDSR